MKRYGDLYSKIYDIENIKNAHKNARKDKSFYKEVQKVDQNKDYYFNQIHKMLKNKTYKVGEYKQSIIVDKGKERQLHKLPYYPDRIIQWAILLQIEDIFVKNFTDFTCASLKHRGIHRASIFVEKYLKDEENTQYCLKFDIKKFYPNINHTVLKKLIRKKIKDKDLLWLLDLIIDSIEGDKGIPIGSYLSQYLANFTLSYFDHWVKEEKKMKYYVRYMDDVIILHNSKTFLHKLLKEIEEYLQVNLDLQIKENWQIFPVDVRGIDFVGYRHFRNYKLLRKTTCKRFKRRMISIKQKIDNKQELNYSEWCSANSYSGWLKYCNSYRLSDKYFKPIKPYLHRYYLKEVKRK